MVNLFDMFFHSYVDSGNNQKFTVKITLILTKIHTHLHTTVGWW